MEFHFNNVWTALSETFPDRPALICEGKTVTWSQFNERAARLAGLFSDNGVTNGASVGMYMLNCNEYTEAHFGCFKQSVCPVNVNYRYRAEELIYLLDNSDAEVVIYHASYAPRIAEIRDSLPKIKLYIQVEDESGNALLEGALDYETALADSTPLPFTPSAYDDRYMLYTGGTTGMPKGEMYPLDGFTEFFMRGFPPMVGLPPFEDASQFGPAARQMVDANTAVVAMSGPPLMHGTGCWLGLMFPHMLGGTSVLLENRGFKPEEVWSTVERDRISQIIIVGDAFAKPLLRALETEPDRWDTSSLKLMISSGAMFTTEVKRGLIDHVPELAIADILGSTEGGMGQSIMTKDTPASETAKFTLLPVAKVLLPDGSREVVPGSGEVGMVAQGGMVPLGYYKDPEKSAKTFKEVDGKRYAFIGDMATVEADGTINLLGRGSNCINTGGEKVFPEEVEEALKLHPDVADALVFGLEDERFGSRVAGVVSLEQGGSAEAGDILEATRKLLASYKLPKDLLVVHVVPRAPNGKADYKTAKALMTGG